MKQGLVIVYLTSLCEITRMFGRVRLRLFATRVCGDTYVHIISRPEPSEERVEPVSAQ
jgi:hypothetical protein